MSDITVLCVDDEQYIIDSIRDYLSADYQCLAFTKPADVLEYLGEHTVDILIADYRMPGMNGYELLKEVRRLGAYKTGILLTAYADKDLLKNLLNDDLVDRALEKPLNLADLKKELDAAAGKIREQREQQEKLNDIYRLLSAEEEADFCFIGKDGDLEELWRQAVCVAPTDENILITGETGTGKDVLARQIHGLSGRAGKPFVKINCGAIPPTLIESELFGHEKGAFSGADRRKFGKIELAHQGTLFLDEIGELPADMQSKLLHVVEDKTLERVGGTATIPMDFRLISATNKELDAAAGGDFRRDLYYRISTVHLKLPELKYRRRDLPLHIHALVGKNAKRFGKPPLEIEPDAMALLLSHSWPGNVRELDNVIKRAILMKRDGDGTLMAGDFYHLNPDCVEKDGSFSSAVSQIARAMVAEGKSLQLLEQVLLSKMVDICEGKIMEASRRTGIPKDRFYRNLEKTES